MTFVGYGMIERFDIPSGATPLIDEDFAGLIPGYILTQSDLNLAEAENISAAKMSFLTSPTKYGNPEYLLHESTVRAIHRAMFGDVWRWAGKYRVRQTNIGVPPTQILERLIGLLGNTTEQIRNCQNTEDAWSELAVRFHWELVRIHPFTNGNGRHARQMADLLIASFGGRPFTWGAKELHRDGEARRAYIDALEKADETFGDISDLVTFARS